MNVVAFLMILNYIINTRLTVSATRYEYLSQIHTTIYIFIIYFAFKLNPLCQHN